jgi:predicted nucleic acid-binding protein
VATREIFADTAGWASYFVRSQIFYLLSKGLLFRAKLDGTRVVTTNCVLGELVSLLTSPLRVPRPLLITTLQAIRSASWVTLVYIDSDLDRQAWTLLDTRPDREWSLVDCASFAVMQRRGIVKALTSDRHFEQAGFVRLLK